MSKRFAACLLSSAFLSTIINAQQPVVRTADPIKRGMQLTDFPRTIKVSDNVYTYEDFHAGPEKFTTTNMFVVTDAGVLVADGQGSVAETKGLVDAIRKVTAKPITTVVIASDHGDHTAGNASFPAGVHYLIHPTSKAILDRSAEAARNASRERLAPAGGRRAGRRQEDLHDGPRGNPDPLPRPLAHRRRPRGVSARPENPVPERDLPEPRLPRHALRLPERVAEGARQSRSDARDHLHRRPRLHRNGRGVAGRDPRVPQGDGSGDRRSDAPLQGRRAGGSGRQAGELGRVWLVDARLVARADRGP